MTLSRWHVAYCLTINKRKFNFSNSQLVMAALRVMCLTNLSKVVAVCDVTGSRIRRRLDYVHKRNGRTLTDYHSPGHVMWRTFVFLTKLIGLIEWKRFCACHGVSNIAALSTRCWPHKCLHVNAIMQLTGKSNNNITICCNFFAIILRYCWHPSIFCFVFFFVFGFVFW